MQKRSISTHNKILQNASILFSTQGYERTGVDQICEAAGISKGAFYHHFPEKHSLFMELLQSWLDSIKTQIDHKFESSSEVSNGFLEIAGSLQEIIGDSRTKLPLLLEFWQQSQRDPELWKKAISPFYQYQEYFLSMINKGIGESPINIENQMLITRVILAFSLGLMTSNLIDPHNDWDSVAKYGFEAIFNSTQRSKL